MDLDGVVEEERRPEPVGVNYEDRFLEEVRNLTRKRNQCSPETFIRYQHDECFTAESLIANLDEPESLKCKIVQKIKNGGSRGSKLYFRNAKKRNRVNKTLFISQPSYLQNTLKRLGMNERKPISTPIEAEKRFHKSLKMKKSSIHKDTKKAWDLIYASTFTRLDISAAVGMLSKFNANPSKEHWAGVKRVLRYLKGTLNYGLTFFVDKDDTSLYGYSDADWG
eukprot:gene8601-9528_t